MSVIDSDDISCTIVVTPTQGGSAVGVESRKWFIGIVKNNTELQCQERLTRQGYEVYVPTQEHIIVTPKGRKKAVTQIMLPAKILIYATEKERKAAVNTPYILRFMTDPARTSNNYGRHPLATIPDSQISDLKFMLGHSDRSVSIEYADISLGDTVEIIRGSLKGLTGTVLQTHTGNTRLYLSLNCLGYASVEIDISEIKKTDN